jgi:hypothetical protein
MLFIIIQCFSCSKDEFISSEEIISYTYSNDIFPNPERGFIRTMITWSAEGELDESLLNTLRDENVTMILRLYYLDAFKTQAIDGAQLTKIHNDFQKIRNAGLKMILRFAYTDDMTGTDASLEMVQLHLNQLKPIFEENKDVIAFFQAGFIGAWGEWHSSSNELASIGNKKDVLNMLLDAIPQDIMIQIRYPYDKQKMYNTLIPVSNEIAFSAVPRARIGHHNDCFLTGGNDYGTYNNIVLDKAYISKEGLHVPVGGETCPPLNGYQPTCEKSNWEMRKLRWTYLNLDWYPETINGWKNNGCFDDFQRNLGYRLLMLDSKLPDIVKKDGKMLLYLRTSNNGYAPIYHKKLTTLVAKNLETNQYYEMNIEIDWRKCKPSGTMIIQQNMDFKGIPNGVYELYMKVTDQAQSLHSRIEYSIRFANENTWTTENNGMNSLNKQIQIID